MPSLLLLVIADPAASFLKALSELPQDVRVIVSNQPEKLRDAVADADAILFADVDSHLLTRILPLARRARWIHCLWTGVDGILKPEVLMDPAPLTNGRGVFRWPLADWVVASMLFFAFHLRRVVRQQEQRVWQPFVAESLKGRTLGIVGYGAVGSAAAVRASHFG